MGKPTTITLEDEIIHKGQRFGMLTALYSHPTDPRYWVYQCDCGKQHKLKPSYVAQRLRAGLPVHCGCLRRPERLEEAHQTDLEAAIVHNPKRRKRRQTLIQHPLIPYWYRIQDEIRNPNHPMYREAHFYDIKMCARWLNNVETFIEDLSPGFRPQSTQRLVRIIRHKDYEPGNVAWMSPTEANMHQNRCMRVDTPDGRMTINKAAKLYKVNPFLIREYHECGRALTDLFGTEPKRRKAAPRLDRVFVPTPEGELLTLTEASKRSGIGRVTIYERMKRNWPIDRLLEPVAKR